MKTEPFHKRARFADEFFKRLFGLIGMSVLHHFHLVELMPSDHAAFFGSVSTRLFSVTRGIREIFHRKFIFVDNLAGIHVDERGFSRGQHEFRTFFIAVFAVNPVNFVGEFGELTRAVTAVVTEHVRR